mmetsp:Transcript_3037/g.4182  ORF Transcript_3037/g.4182 Transcript_3037/m.4182 type:complete len:418 (+) Transcript_3037:1825-3078(+)
MTSSHKIFLRTITIMLPTAFLIPNLTNNHFKPSLTLTATLMPVNTRADWFETAFGFQERAYDYNGVREKFQVEYSNDTDTDINNKNAVLVSRVNGRVFDVGRFELASMEDLCERCSAAVTCDVHNDGNSNQSRNPSQKLTFCHVTGDAKTLHTDVNCNSNNDDGDGDGGVVFQAASQFNCLEMPSPDVTPDMGITDYVFDRTQGPACAMACFAGTLYRNYFVNGVGQGNGNQIDCLSETGDVLGNQDSKFWVMKNGYALPVARNSIDMLKQDMVSGAVDVEKAVAKVKVGIQWNCEVRDFDSDIPSHHVTQVYCSALPVGYSDVYDPKAFAPFAKLVLTAAYTSTLAVGAILSQQRKNSVVVYLTKVGGGVFRNEPKWIIEAIQSSLRRFQNYPLDVRLVHFGSIESAYRNAIAEII